MSRMLAACGVLCAASVGFGQAYNFELNQAASSATWSAAVDAPFQTTPTGTSFIIGNYHAVNNPTGTRTIPGLAGGDVNGNTPVPITAGALGAEGSSGSTAVHPSGTFGMSVDTGAMTCAVSSLSLDLLGGAPGVIANGVNITYQSFRTRQPTCTIFGGFPIDVPLGNGEIVSILATQTGATDSGTITPAGGDSYNFSIPLQVTVVIEALFNGLPVPIDPQDVSVVLTGTITLNGENAAITAGVTIDQKQTQVGPFVVPALAFDEPFCGGHLLLNLTLAEVTVDLFTDADFVADGTDACTVDFDGDGFVTGTDFDLYVQAFEGGELSADFDGDGFITGLDFDAFVQAFEIGC